MTSLYTGYRNVYQPQFNFQQESKEREERVRERELRDSKTSRVVPKEKAEDINAFLEELQKNRKILQQNTALRQQMQDEIAKRKLMLSNAIQMNKLASYESNNQQVQQEIKGLVQQLAKLLAAQSELEETQNKALDSSSSLAISAAVKKAMLKQQAMLTPFITKRVQETAPLTAEVATQEATESVTNPLLRSAPTETAESTTQAKSTGAATYADDITNIGQDSMTPEEQFWHELSLYFANITSEFKYYASEVERIKKMMDAGVEMAAAKSELNALMDKFNAFRSALSTTININIPEGLPIEKINELLEKLNLKDATVVENNIAKINFGSVTIPGTVHVTFTNLMSMITTAFNTAINAFPSFIDMNILLGRMKMVTIDLMPSIISGLHTHYPSASQPETDDSTLSGWLDGMLPGFDSIDKSNLNFYKSIIALITAWQKKINEFNTRYAEVLKGSSGIDQSDGKHRFDADAVDKMLAMLDDISAMEHSMALILGGVTDDDLANLLEGTGINCTEMVGTVALLDIGKDVAKMLKDAIGNCFNTTIDNGKKYVVTPEQLTHFNTVLTQAQNQFDSVVKKVNTKTDSAKSLFNDTREALSNMLKTAETLLADLAKMLR